MANERLPEWVEVGAYAFLVTQQYYAGVGAVPSAERVRIVKINGLHVYATEVVDEATYRFRRRDLTIPGSASKWAADDRLAERGDPEVVRAQRLARIVADLPDGDEWASALRRVERYSPARIAEDIPGQLAELIEALRVIEAKSSAALVKLRTLQATI